MTAPKRIAFVTAILLALASWQPMQVDHAFGMVHGRVIAGGFTERLAVIASGRTIRFQRTVVRHGATDRGRLASGTLMLDPHHGAPLRSSRAMSSFPAGWGSTHLLI